MVKNSALWTVSRSLKCISEVNSCFLAKISPVYLFSHHLLPRSRDNRQRPLRPSFRGKVTFEGIRGSLWNLFMPHEPRIPGRRRRALGHFRRKLGLTCLDPTIRKTQGGDREGAMIHTDRGQMPHCAFLTQDVWERPGRNLGQGPRELAFRKHIPVTPPQFIACLSSQETNWGSVQFRPWL